MAKTRKRLPVAAQLPAATAISAGVQFAPDATNHPVRLEVMFLDRTGEAHVLPVLLGADLASAVGLQLDRTSRLATVLKGKR